MLLENRIKLCNTLTPAEYAISEYILKNKEIVVELSIQQIADAIPTSKSAILRLCKKLDMKGFNELKVKLAQDLADIERDRAVVDVNYPFEQKDSPKRIAAKLMELYEETIHDTYRYIDAVELGNIASLLYNAQVIDIYTHAHNLNPAENFKDKMLTIGRVVNCPKSFYEKRMMVLASSQTHVALILSYSGKATFIQPILKELHRRNTPVVFIGKAGSNLYPQYVKHYLPISDKENLRDRISQFSSHIALQYMLDVLYGCIFNKNRKQNMEYLHDTISFMDDRILEDDSPQKCQKDSK